MALCEEMEEGEGRELTVLFGSETGCAQDVAETLAREGRRRLFRVRVLAMDDFDVTTFPQHSTLVFVASTTGQGQAPHNMQGFWKALLRKSLPPSCLSHLRYGVFGLGDSSYPKFNVVAKRLHKRLEQLGAECFCELGLGNDQDVGGYELRLLPWMDDLWDRLMRLHPLPPNTPLPNKDALLAPRHAVREVAKAAAQAARPHDQRPHGPGKPFSARVCANSRLTSAGHWQDVRHIELDIEGSGLRHAAGDVLCLKPVLPAPEVEAFLAMFGLLGTTVVDVAPVDQDDTPWPHPLPRSLFDLFSKDLNILAVPRRSLVRRLAPFAADPMERERLEEFGSPEGLEDFEKYCTNEHRSLLEVLQDFKSVRPPLAHLVDLVPPLKPRLFSIASSPELHPDRVQLAVALVSFRTPYGRQKEGLCSRFLRTTEPGDRARVWITPGTLRFPYHASHVIMVGPGTGVAPFRAMLQELQARVQRRECGADQLPSTSLYFGCRNKEHDHIYRSEMASWAASGIVAHLHVAYSRDQPHKVYVQHLLSENDNARVVWEALGQSPSGVLLLAGSANQMPNDVVDAVVRAFCTFGGLEEQAARKAVQALELRNRIVMETWS